VAIVAFDFNKRRRELARGLVGSRVTQVGLGEWAVQLLVDGGSIYVDSSWELTDISAGTLDRSREFKDRDTFALWRIVGSSIVNFDALIDDVFRIALFLDNGMVFRAWEDEPGLESIMISLIADRQRVVR
jgi:hypothetical protein